ncbi:hypothetical protein [Novosphingobium colocasiae]|uniref:hypothetical protein n=1 Tax=Novosphingobium colocasiae TaxID=1256513 RepID=UPI0035B1C1A7
MKVVIHKPARAGGKTARAAANTPRETRPLCAVCMQEHCHHSDLEYSGLIPPVAA